MKDIRHIHREAMAQSDLALVERMKGNPDAAQRHSRTAYQLESEAANALLNELGAEPTRSVLFRSAATLARDCGLLGDAERLIYKALAGDPPPNIETELHDLLEQVNFERHLELRGVKLGSEEIQMTITGRSVGFGIAPTDVFLSRVQSTENLLYRTAERKQNRPYRDKRRRDQQLARDLELYMTAPRAACFAVTFRVGASLQESLPGLSPTEEVVDELFECLDLYTRGDETQLRERITDEAYYRNFVGLARNLQPDGTKVNMVGFTAVRRGQTKQVSLKRSAGEPTPAEDYGVLPSVEKPKAGEELVRFRGELLIANATKKTGKQSGEIEIVTAGNIRMKVVVPPGMMSDIVKPLWESEVEVVGTRKGRRIHLMQIKAAA